MPELIRRLGWTEKQILNALTELNEKGFIEWNPKRHSSIKIIKPSDLDWRINPGANPQPMNYWEMERKRELYGR